MNILKGNGEILFVAIWEKKQKNQSTDMQAVESREAL